MIREYAIGLAFVLLLGIHGHAIADEACQSPAEVTADIEKSAPPFLAIEQIADISGAALKPFVDTFNSLPPASEYQADHVMVFHALVKTTGEEHPQFVVALFFHGCKQAAAMVPAAIFKPLIGAGA